MRHEPELGERCPICHMQDWANRCMNKARAQAAKARGYYCVYAGTYLNLWSRTHRSSALGLARLRSTLACHTTAHRSQDSGGSEHGVGYTYTASPRAGATKSGWRGPPMGTVVSATSPRRTPLTTATHWRSGREGMACQSRARAAPQVQSYSDVCTCG